MRNELPNNAIEMTEENTCEADGSIYFSNPSQNRCKNCGRFWYCGHPVPICNTQPSPKPDFIKDQWNSQIDAMIAEIGKEEMPECYTENACPILLTENICFNRGLSKATQILLTYKR